MQTSALDTVVEIQTLVCAVPRLLAVTPYNLSVTVDVALRDKIVALRRGVVQGSVATCTDTRNACE